ncbi:hypothetical protein EB118_18130 [bacterium]|nr:hypothetical protein [bacterium]NDC95847.1 hypothetical protein [bacterium]NDD85530.1 hypothetical protein [bacterium]NDG31978.1 hypothetical protein [bacterium]
MKDPENRKDSRRQSLQNHNRSKKDISEEQKFMNKAKKQLKKRIEESRADEAWEAWEDWEST